MGIRLNAEKRAARAKLRAEIAAIERPERLEAAKARAKMRAAAEKRVGKREAGQRQARETDPGFLAYLRRQACEARALGGCEGPIEAAHIRYSDASKGAVNPGMQRKNHDRHANPLCHQHHQHDQHKKSERAFWARLDKDAYDTAARHFAAYLKGTK